MSNLKEKLFQVSQLIISKKKTIFISLGIVVIATVIASSLLLYKKLTKIQKFSGRISYVKNDNLRIRDYNRGKDYLLSKKIGVPDQISWSPLGKYIYTLKNNQLFLFNVERLKKIDTQAVCNFTDVNEAKWAGRSETLSIRDNSKFILCNPEGSKKDFNLKLKDGESILDWVPINENYVVALVINKKNNLSRFLKLNIGDGALTEIAVEKENVIGKDGKYLWFAEDRNFVYITKGAVNRILFDEDFNITYKNTVKVGEDIEPLGWDLDICVGGKIFIPKTKFLVLDKTGDKSLVKQISFTAPQKYSSSGKDIRLEKGETYWELAERIFGDGARWKELYKYNTRREPTQLQIGAKLYIPLEEIKSFEDFQTISNGDVEAIYMPQLFVLSSAGQVFYLTANHKENEVLEKFSPSLVLFAAKTTLQNEARKFIVENNREISVYSDIATKIDSIKEVDKVIWDWSNGYCYNHKYGEAIPSAPDVDLDKQKCLDRMEIKQYGIIYHDVCQEDWNEKIVNGVTVLENEKLGVELDISRLVVTSVPDNLPFQNSSGTKYNVKSLTDGSLEYKFYFEWSKGGGEVQALRVICKESEEGKCETIAPNFGWLP